MFFNWGCPNDESEIVEKFSGCFYFVQIFKLILYEKSMFFYQSIFWKSSWIF